MDRLHIGVMHITVNSRFGPKPLLLADNGDSRLTSSPL